MKKKTFKVKKHLRRGRKVTAHSRARTYLVVRNADGSIEMRPFKLTGELAYAYICGSGVKRYGSIDVDQAYLDDDCKISVFAVNPYPSDPWMSADDVRLKGFTQGQIDTLKQAGAFKK